MILFVYFYLGHWIQEVFCNVSRFDYLKYNTDDLHQQHLNCKKYKDNGVNPVNLQFYSHERLV